MLILKNLKLGYDKPNQPGSNKLKDLLTNSKVRLISLMKDPSIPFILNEVNNDWED
jgi:hypothetical protein